MGRTVRRAAAVLGLGVALLLCGNLAAWAAFQDRAPAGTTGVTTATITAPTDVVAVRESCSNARWIDVTVSWQASSSSPISGYSVTAFRDDGRSFQVGSTSSGATSLTTRVDKHDGPVTSVAFSVATLTSYGWWSAESALSGTVSC